MIFIYVGSRPKSEIYSIDITLTDSEFADGKF